jgi:hypothetical protein
MQLRRSSGSGRLVGFDNDLPAAAGRDAAGDHAVVGQVEEGGGSLKRVVAASTAAPVGSFKARGPVPGLSARHSSQQGHGSFFSYDPKSIPHQPQAPLRDSYQQSVRVERQE